MMTLATNTTLEDLRKLESPPATIVGTYLIFTVINFGWKNKCSFKMSGTTSFVQQFVANYFLKNCNLGKHSYCKQKIECNMLGNFIRSSRFNIF